MVCMIPPRPKVILSKVPARTSFIAPTASAWTLPNTLSPPNSNLRLVAADVIDLAPVSVPIGPVELEKLSDTEPV